MEIKDTKIKLRNSEEKIFILIEMINGVKMKTLKSKIDLVSYPARAEGLVNSISSR